MNKHKNENTNKHRNSAKTRPVLSAILLLLALTLSTALFSGCAMYGATNATQSDNAASTATQSGNADAAATQSGDSDTTAMRSGDAEAADIGDGAAEFAFEATDKDGQTAKWTVHTDEATVGAALLAVGLIKGENSDYGLYVTEVNGQTADYDADKAYWAFYIDGEYAVSGADATEIETGKVYAFVYTAE